MAQPEQSSQPLSYGLYTYQPLPDEHAIRILMLNPGEDDEPLSGQIETAHLIGRRQASSAPQSIWSVDRPYEAISYVWGSNTMDHSIYLDGKAHKITANMSDALHQCRLPYETRALWADSICIDQADLKEKGHQVALMSRIYSCSQRTLICLGSDPGHRYEAEEAFSFLLEANEMIERTFLHPDFTWRAGCFPWPDPGDPLVNDSRWRSLVVLTSLGWFKRGWVVQEVSLGRDALILWAGLDLPWLILIRVNTWYGWRIFQMPSQPASLIPVVRTEWYLHPLFVQTHVCQQLLEAQTFRSHISAVHSILFILDSARELTLSDPRDRIYAFTGLPYQQGQFPALEPDYEQSHSDIYQAFAVKYLDVTQDLNILLCVRHSEPHLSNDQGSSWIPQWDRGSTNVGVRACLDRVGGFGDRDIELCGFNIIEGKADFSPYLKVKAVIFDTIISTSIRLERNSTIKDVVAIWKSMEKSRLIALSQGQSNATILSFLKALSNGCWHGHSEEAWHELTNAYARFVDNAMAQMPGIAESLETPASIQHFHHCMIGSVFTHKVFLLSQGNFGIGPWVIEEGDICAFVFGVVRPLILRSIPGGKAHHFKVVGYAYVVSKGLDEEGISRGFNEMYKWNDWDKLSKIQDLVSLNLKVDEIILH